MLKGPRTRFSTSIIAAGPKAQPSRWEAKPKIFENVRSMTTLSQLSTSSAPAL